RQLAAQLGLDRAKVRMGNAVAGAAELGSVRSAPLRDRLRDLMVHSDNVLAETVGREGAVPTGHEASFEGAVTAASETRRQAGFDLTGAAMYDSSGLSVDDRVPAQLLDTVLATAARADGVAPTGEATTAGTPARPATDRLTSTLAQLLDDLPVAGGTGSLTS